MSHCVRHGDATNPTFHPWASPIGMERHRNPSCYQYDPNTRSIPVTHCSDGYERRGFYWYYSAIGCSDMYADLGPKTLVSKNRCHAAALLSGKVQWWKDIPMKKNFLDRALRSVPNVSDPLKYLFADCVRGVFQCNKKNVTMIRSYSIARHRCYISGHDLMSKYIAQKMRLQNYSSVQFLEQPEGDIWNMNHEILFLKEPRHFTKNGEECVRAKNKGCQSCKNAYLIQNITKWRRWVLRPQALKKNSG